jgi:hypothetical protein
MKGIAAMVTAVSLLVPGMGSASDIPDPQVKGQGGDGVIDVLGHRDRPGGGDRDSRSSSGRQVLVVPACAGNEPAAGLLDASCLQALAMCASTAAPDDVMMWVFSGPPGVSVPSPGQWARVAARCLRPAVAARLQGRPVFSVSDFRRLPLPAGGVRVQPANLVTLVNVPTNVFVDAPVRVLETSLLGFPVRVRVTPRLFRWGFGDGRQLVTEDPGAAFPDLRVTHTYLTEGSVRVDLVTEYSGEYSVAGGAWLPVDGTAQVASAPVTLTVLAAHNELRAVSG